MHWGKAAQEIVVRASEKLRIERKSRVDDPAPVVLGERDEVRKLFKAVSDLPYRLGNNDGGGHGLEDLKGPKR